MKNIMCLALLFTSVVHSAEPLELRIKNHKFSPTVFKVKANERFKIKIINEDPTSEEFESNTMIIEKFIGPKRTIVVNLGPLKAGTYEFFGDFHMSTAQGQVIAE